MQQDEIKTALQQNAEVLSEGNKTFSLLCVVLNVPFFDNILMISSIHMSSVLAVTFFFLVIYVLVICLVGWGGDTFSSLGELKG